MKVNSSYWMLNEVKYTSIYLCSTNCNIVSSYIVTRRISMYNKRGTSTRVRVSVPVANAIVEHCGSKPKYCAYGLSPTCRVITES